MGDRCYLTLSIRKQDEALLLAAMRLTGDAGAEDDIETVANLFENNGDGTYRLTIEEANYAMTEERQMWAKIVNFTGSHGNGDNYNAMQFVAWAGELIEVDDDDHGRLMCPVSEETGQPHPEALTHIQRYLAACRAFDASVKDQPADLPSQNRDATVPESSDAPE